ncbi:MAG: isoprenylcysteine carboxylmethyltransferase family protein [Bdellovibrionales bacterium]|nr:isoprenylcysteine carboxylmethyltransferase family protein [Bdellovibrionales bacterium]
MESIRTFFLVWGLFGFSTTLTGIYFLRGKASDEGIKLSATISLLYSGLTVLSAWLAFEPLPGWWATFIAPVGLMLAFLSQALSFWAKKSLGTQFTPNLAPAAGAKLIQEGPFAICRHPMMLSYLMMWMGTAIALGSNIMSISFGLISILIMRRVALEEKSMRQTFGSLFAEYCAGTPMIVPFLDPQSLAEAEIERSTRRLATEDWTRDIWKCR